jgi:hypothetical protein
MYPKEFRYAQHRYLRRRLSKNTGNNRPYVYQILCDSKHIDNY